MSLEIVAVSVFCFVVGLSVHGISDTSLNQMGKAFLPAILTALWVYAMLKTRLGQKMSSPVRIVMVTVGLSIAFLFWMIHGIGNTHL